MLFDLLGRKRGKVLKLCALIEYLIKNILGKNHAEASPRLGFSFGK